LKKYSNEYEDYPQVIVRVDHSSNWKVLILAAAVIAVIMFWPRFYKFVSIQIDQIKQAEIQYPSNENEQEIADMVRPVSFDEVLDAALRYDRVGDRKQAESLFRKLLMQAAKNTKYTEQMVALFPRAADFYSKGDEIPAEQVEYLYLDALDAIKKFHGTDYYDYENVHRGLEKHYLSHGRYKKAAFQTEMLLEFYRRYYKDNKDTQYALIKPTTIRLGHNLLAAGQNAKARDVYQSALLMTRKRDQPVSAIEEFIKKTYQQGEDIPSTITVTPQIPASIGANIPSVTSDPSSVGATDDIKNAIKAISLDGIYIEQLQENDDHINIIGYADDNKTVAKYMRLIYESVGEPTINWVEHEEREQRPVSAFSIKMKK